MFMIIPNYLENPVKHPHFDFASRIDPEIDIRIPRGLNARLF